MEDVNKNIKSIKKELERLYQLVPISKGSELEFLRGLGDYLNFMRGEKILNKIIHVMKEDSLRESIQILKESAEDINASTWYESSEYMEKFGNQYPIYEYDRLLEMQEDFSEVKELKTVAEVSAAQINVITKTSSGESSRRLSGRGLIVLVEVYSNLLEPLHKFLLKRLDWIQEQGVFSKYLDYSEKTGTLYFQEKEIKINVKKTLSNAHFLLIYLFSHNPFEQHFCDELNDAKVLFETDKFWKSYYDACGDIQKKVEKATEISDFLDFNSGQGMYVRINPKYSLAETL